MSEKQERLPESAKESRLWHQARLLGQPMLSGAVKAVTYVAVLHALDVPHPFSFASLFS